MKIYTASVTLLTSIIFVPAARAERQLPPPLYQLACQYETAVEEFEGLVCYVRGIDRADEKLVDRLDDRAAKFRFAARNPRNLNRLFFEWQEVQKLEAQVEQRIFGKYTPNHELTCGWRVVMYQHDLFAQEFFHTIENRRHGNSVRRIPTTNALRDRYFPAASAVLAPTAGRSPDGRSSLAPPLPARR